VERPARILVVDDTPDNVQLLRLEMEDEGYEVICAMNGLDALECAARDEIDVILMDWMMPVMDGITALRELKSNPLLAAIPVVMVSAKFSETDVIEGLDARTTILRSRTTACSCSPVCARRYASRRPTTRCKS
jgi:CheY-like chemotaxis protein